MTQKINDGLTNWQRWNFRHSEKGARQREWRLLHPEKVREWNTNRNLKKVHERHMLYNKNNPEKIKADRVATHIPLGNECQFGGCHSTKNLEHAHLDYDFPLETVTFCRRHHTIVDRLYRVGGF